MKTILVVAALCGQLSVEGEPGRLVELTGRADPPDGFEVATQSWTLCRTDAIDWRSYTLEDGSSRFVFTAKMAGDWRPEYTVTYVDWEAKKFTTESHVYTIRIRGPPVVDPGPGPEPDPRIPPPDQRLSVVVYESYDQAAPLYLQPARVTLQQDYRQRLMIVDQDQTGPEVPEAAVSAGVANGLPALVVLSEDGETVFAVTDLPPDADSVVAYCTQESYE